MKDTLLPEEAYCRTLFSWDQGTDELDFEMESNHFRESLEEAYESRMNQRLLLYGRLGLWNGNPEGGKLCDSVRGLLSTMFSGDYEVGEVYVEDGHTYVTLSHHDGTHRFELYIVEDDADVDDLDPNYPDDLKDMIGRDGVRSVDLKKEVYDA